MQLRTSALIFHFQDHSEWMSFGSLDKPTQVLFIGHERHADRYLPRFFLTIAVTVLIILYLWNGGYKVKGYCHVPILKR